MSDVAEWGTPRSDPDTSVNGRVAVILWRGVSGSNPIRVMVDADATVGQLKAKLRGTGQLTDDEYAEYVARGKLVLQGGMAASYWSLRDDIDDYGRFMATKAVKEVLKTHGSVEFALLLETPRHSWLSDASCSGFQPERASG